MSVKGYLRRLFLTKIKHYTCSDLIIDHLRRVGAEIGDNCYLFSDSLETTEPYLIKIGDNVTVAGGTRFITHDDSAEFYFHRGSLTVGRINIGNNVFIGAESVILPGVTISDNCIVGAGSVVTHSITEQGSVVAGVPARIISNIGALKEKNKNQCIVTEGMSFEEKKQYILKNEDMLKRV
jgi:acetyltransferase-like isoleucine patch superfamily enzyme